MVGSRNMKIAAIRGGSSAGSGSGTMIAEEAA